MRSLACGTARGISSFVLASVFVSVPLLFAFLGTEPHVMELVRDAVVEFVVLF